jgi:hypothetical protein
MSRVPPPSAKPIANKMINDISASSAITLSAGGHVGRWRQQRQRAAGSRYLSRKCPYAARCSEDRTSETMPARLAAGTAFARVRPLTAPQVPGGRQVVLAAFDTVLVTTGSRGGKHLSP